MQIRNTGHNGIHLPASHIVLDGAGTDPQAHIFISHAHSDHVPGKRSVPVYASPATAALMRARGHRGPVRELTFGQTLALPSADVTMYPAGHILGSAMFFIETEEGSLLYTGDCRRPPSPASEGFALPDRSVDQLIIEATFGLPLYKWEPHEVLFSQIRTFAAKTLDAEAVPILLCYSLGKAQEVMMALAASDPPVTVQIHPAGVPLTRIYEEFGMSMGHWEPFDPENLAGKVLIIPSSALNNPDIRMIPNRRLAYVSGWASIDAYGSRLMADTLIPLSDHLDFFSLMDLCREIAPGHIWLTHSPNPDVALHYLQKEGFSCGFLEKEQYREV